MNFFEPDEPRTVGPRRRTAPDAELRRQFLIRRAAAAGVAILILILLVLGVRGCLNSRKQQGLENYVGDLGAVVNESNKLGENLFGRLDDPENLDEAELEGDRGAAESLLTAVQAIETPDEVAGAQEEIVLAFELRRDGVAAITSSAGKLGGENGKAPDKVARDVQGLIASDALYRRARGDIDAVLREEGVDERAPQSQFVPGPDPVERLDPESYSAAS